MTISIIQGKKFFYCIKCRDVETVIMKSKDEMHKHLEDFHGWFKDESRTT